MKGLKYKTSRVSFIGNYGLIILLLIFLTLVLPQIQPSSLISEIATLGISLLVLVLLLEPEAEIVVREYMITNAEVVKVEGILTKKTFAIPYQSVADVKTIMGVVGRIFNFGDVVVKGMKEDIVMKGILNPEVAEKVIWNKIALMKKPEKIKKASERR